MKPAIIALILCLCIEPAQARPWTEFKEALEAGKKDKQIRKENEAYILGLRDGLVRGSQSVEYEPGKRLFCYPDSSKLINPSEIIDRIEQDQAFILKLAPNITWKEWKRIEAMPGSKTSGPFFKLADVESATFNVLTKEYLCRDKEKGPR